MYWKITPNIINVIGIIKEYERRVFARDSPSTKYKIQKGKMPA